MNLFLVFLVHLDKMARGKDVSFKFGSLVRTITFKVFRNVNKAHFVLFWALNRPEYLFGI